MAEKAHRRLRNRLDLQMRVWLRSPPLGSSLFGIAAYRTSVTSGDVGRREGAAGESAAHETPSRIEPRWPVALALGSFVALTIVLRVFEPHRESLGPEWLVPGIEIVLLLVLVAADPAQISGRRRWLRPLSIALVSALAVAAAVSTGVLIGELIRGGTVTDSATSLLSSGALIWLGNCIVFGLLYWLLDSGGPYARYVGEREYPDFAFTQQQSPELAPPGWKPQYVDYLILGLTTSTAFSPTDVLPMARWAKLTMGLQSLISLSVIGLVIARAVNVFT